MDLTGLGGIAALAKGLVNRFFPPDATPEQKMAMQQAIVNEVQKRDEVKGRIIVAEMQQGDNYTKRARPTVVYAGLVIIFLNYVLFPFVGRVLGLLRDGMTEAQLAMIEPLALPGEFWAAWGGVVSIWVLGRSAEKRGTGGNLGKLASLITGGK